MRSRFLQLAIAGCIVLASAQAAQSQSIYNPTPGNTSPYSRPALSPYLNIIGGPASNYYLQTLREFDIRNQMMRPIVVLPEGMSGYDPARSPGYQSVATYQSGEDWVNQRIRETQLSPTGHPAGFLMPSPYYRLPNQRSFIPYNPNTGAQLRP